MGKKKKIIITIISIVAIISIATLTYSFYYQSVNINFKTNFVANIEHPNYGYIRAMVITDWFDEANNAVAAKNPWELKTSAINSNWIKKDDGYYYFENAIDTNNKTRDQLITEISQNYPIISDGLSASQLSDESLSNPKYKARYKVIFEMLLEDAEVGESVTNEAWNVVYTNHTLVH